MYNLLSMNLLFFFSFTFEQEGTIFAFTPRALLLSSSANVNLIFVTSTQGKNVFFFRLNYWQRMKLLYALCINMNSKYEMKWKKVFRFSSSPILHRMSMLFIIFYSYYHSIFINIKLNSLRIQFSVYRVVNENEL